MFMVPYQENTRFVGREKFLQTLKSKLSTGHESRWAHRIALYGMGGIGKTQCALRYVYTNKDDYDMVFWITAADQSSLLSGYQEIARQAKLPRLENAPPVEVAKAVISWLKKESETWLLVIDNLDDIMVAGSLLPENGPGKHTIITTRDPKTGSIPAEPVEVPLLDDIDAFNLLCSHSEIDILPQSVEKTQADEILREFGGLPLAIEQAAAFVRATGDLLAFANEYHKNRQAMHVWVPSQSVYPYSLATTWSMSFKMIQRYHPHAANLLRILAFLNPDGVLIEFLMAGADGLEGDLRELLSNRIDLAMAVSQLERLSLVKWDRLGQSISIHRLIQEVVSDEMSEDEQTMNMSLVIDLIAEAFPIKNPDDDITLDMRHLCQRYQSQVLEPLLRSNTLVTEKSARVRTSVICFLSDDGKYEDTEKLVKRNIEIMERVFGADSTEMLNEMGSLFLVYSQQRRWEEACKVGEEVLAKKRKILGNDHIDTLRDIQNLGEIYFSQNRLTEAFKLQSESFERRKRVQGEDHPGTLLCMGNMAANYCHQGRLAEAEILFKEVVERRKRTLGEEHAYTLSALRNLGITYWRQGRREETRKLFELVLEKRKKVLGEQHPDTIEIMEVLSRLYRDMGKTTEAAKLQEEAESIKKKISRT